MKLIEFSLLIIFVIILVKVFKFLLHRAMLFSSILGIRKIDGAEVEICDIKALILPKPTKKPLFRVNLRGKTYAVRLFNGKGHSHAAHIVNSRYASVFLKTGGALKARRFARTLVKVEEPARVYFPRTVFLPDLPESSTEIPILLFSPAPRELTFVTPERNSIKAAFTGDEVFRMKVYTKSTFVNFIDRDSRGFFD